MSMRQLLARLVALIRRDRAEADLTRELRAHMALIEDDCLARGMSREEASVAARRAIGGIEQTKERHRDARSFGWLEDLRRDVPYAVRGLMRDRSFTAAAVLTLALGIGTTTAVFSVVNAVLLQPLPYEDSDRLVRIVENLPPSAGSSTPRQRLSMSRAELMEWRSRTTTLSHLSGGLMAIFAQVETPQGGVRALGQAVSPELFDMLGARAALGRTLDASDTGPSSNAIVLSTSLWREQFHGDPDIIGRPVVVRYQNQGTRTFVAVGVMPDDFDFPSAGTRFWTALQEAGAALPANIGVVTARLRDGVSPEAAAQEADTIGRALRPLADDSHRLDAPARFELLRLKDEIITPVRSALRVLSIAVGFVLLIVCANVANLLLARATSRQREIAVRLAIGAGRGRIVRQIMTESLVLAVVGGGLGIWLALAGVQALKTFATVDATGLFQLSFGTHILPRLPEARLDGWFLAIAVGLTAAASLLFGIAPALHLSGLQPRGAMAARDASGGAARGNTRLRNLLVIGQVTMATTMLVAAGLLLNSFIRLSTTNPGYDAEQVVTFQLAVPYDYSTARRLSVVDTLLERLQAVPQVTASGFAYVGPLIALENTLGAIVPQGKALDDFKGRESPRALSVSAGYLQAMGTRLVSGRWLRPGPDMAGPMPILVNETAVRQIFDGIGPVENLVRLHPPKGPTVLLQVVGVVEDIRQKRMDIEPTPQIFIEHHHMLSLTRRLDMTIGTQESLALGVQSFSLRVIGDPAALITDVRALVHQIDPAAGIDGIAPMTRVVAASLTRERFYSVLVAVLAGIAAALAALGVYGVLAYAVVQRTQEIGVRMALGAQRDQVLRLVLRRGVLLTTLGIALGLAGAAALTRYLAGMLYGLTPLDLTTYVTVAALFAAVALLASYLPARRATQVDPMVALRCE